MATSTILRQRLPGPLSEGLAPGKQPITGTRRDRRRSNQRERGGRVSMETDTVAETNDGRRGAGGTTRTGGISRGSSGAGSVQEYACTQACPRAHDMSARRWRVGRLLVVLATAYIQSAEARESGGQWQGQSSIACCGNDVRRAGALSAT